MCPTHTICPHTYLSPYPMFSYTTKATRINPQYQPTMANQAHTPTATQRPPNQSTHQSTHTKPEHLQRAVNIPTTTSGGGKGRIC